MTVLHTKSVRNYAKLFESDAFIKVSCMNVRRNNCVELQNFESVSLCLCDAVKHELLAEVKSAVL